MKLLLLSIEFPPGPGGSGTLAFQIAEHLTRAGWAVTVSTPQDHVDRATVERFNAREPFQVSRLHPVEPPLREGAYRFREAWRIVRRTGTDALVAVGKQAVWIGAVLSLVSGLPLVAVGIGLFIGPVGGAVGVSFGFADVAVGNCSTILVLDHAIKITAIMATNINRFNILPFIQTPSKISAPSPG